MKRGGLWIPASVMLLAAMTWAGCTDDDDDDGAAGSTGIGGSGGSTTDAGKGGTGGGTGGSTDAGTGGSSTDGGAGADADTDASTEGGTEGGTDGGTEGGTDGGTDGGTAACQGDWTPGGTCATCLESKCCDTLAACADVTDCIACLSDEDPQSTACTEQNLDPAQALYTCAEANCTAECLTPPLACDAPATSPSNGSCVTVAGAIECNPVTNAGCTGAGEACDVNQAGTGYECYPAPNTQTLCQACSQTEGYCQGGLTCVGQCAKYCCTNADCGTGICDTSQGLPGGAGMCLAAAQQTDGGVSEGGTEGGAEGGATDAATD